MILTLKDWLIESASGQAMKIKYKKSMDGWLEKITADSKIDQLVKEDEFEYWVSFYIDGKLHNIPVTLYNVDAMDKGDGEYDYSVDRAEIILDYEEGTLTTNELLGYYNQVVLDILESITDKFLKCDIALSNEFISDEKYQDAFIEGLMGFISPKIKGAVKKSTFEGMPSIKIEGGLK